jgi:hypothetical protein
MEYKKMVTMISTYHSHYSRTLTITDMETIKPLSVLEYNQCMGGIDLKKCMGGIDLKNQMLHSYIIEREWMHKWYMKLFH